MAHITPNISWLEEHEGTTVVLTYGRRQFVVSVHEYEGDDE